MQHDRNPTRAMCHSVVRNIVSSCKGFDGAIFLWSQQMRVVDVSSWVNVCHWLATDTVLFNPFELDTCAVVVPEQIVRKDDQFNQSDMMEVNKDSQ
ncbi:hypothetical protein E1301_Tti020774 [Triplophysa tibetana]|uniref:Uncharacterized protein n=1 Tax=Triplophysa tibetana TaxID=1572043 RepID=A0A5A9PHH2_9TELE|nr:hypothetical protein E1301_Tti020774 [Triplophysa tibetana]